MERMMSFPEYRVRRSKSDEKQSFLDAVQAYNQDHARDFGPPGGQCPICSHNGCFGNAGGPLQGSGRWACFSANHGRATGQDGKPIGVKGNGCHHGDALDIDAHQANQTRHQHLKNTSYL